MQINIDLSILPEITADKFYPLYTNKARHLHLYGGAGSSKSRFTAQKWLVRIAAGLKTKKKHTILAMRKTSPAARKSVYELFKNYIYEWEWDNIFKPFDSTMMIVNQINGSKIICTGLDDPTKLKSIEGVTGIWLEEATEFTKADIQQCNIRLRGNFDYFQIIYTYNPVDLNHFLYESIYSGKPDRYEGWHDEDTFIHYSTYKDNPFIDENYKKVLEGLKEEDEGFYKIYTLGLWGALKNLIYTNFIIDSDFPQSFDDECYGLDFGYNNPSCLVHVGDKDQEPYVSELIYESKLNVNQLIERMKDIGVKRDTPIYADGSRPEMIDDISSAGFDCRPAVEARKPKAVKGRIEFCKRRRIHLHPAAVNLKKEISAYKWKEDKQGHVLDEPVKFLDHGMNAFEYARFEHFKYGNLLPGSFTA